ncbi:FecR family protein [Caulobacter sp. UNC279MFTsu5.1]|uniref:FecR family protein n=1 Tax=Caulobacter sp. UNC279MFTsu5.1 TaxID=1502775 RepID=UPI0008F27912|nr:FecR domain-containing protein [Caulobacter sp. UNC279MFTsu5.1]SFJ65419.1 FecR family protein [Caulobacter sp. UNC279MFTsu5.1]
MIDREKAEDIEAEAARWVWRRDRDGRTPELEARVDAWLAGDVRRHGALLKAEATWSLLDRARHTAPRPAVRPVRSASRRAWLAGTGGAIAAAMVGAGVLVLREDRFRTGVGEVRRVPLEDGSAVAINTASQVEVAFRREQRTVRLRTGEAWFQVARDVQRPFVVEAGAVRVRAVGTAFSVRRRLDGADVLVTEGVVEVWAEGSTRAPARLKAGQGAFVANGVGLREATPAAVDRKLEWRYGKIDLAGETLRDAVADFNRYNDRKLVIADPTIADERFYGVFNTGGPEAFATAVGASLGVEVEVRGDEIVLGGRRAS